MAKALLTRTGLHSSYVTTVGFLLLSTLSATAVAAYAVAHRATRTSPGTLVAQATVHGYHIVFTTTTTTAAAGFLVVGALIAGLLLRRGAMASLSTVTPEEEKTQKTDPVAA